MMKLSSKLKKNYSSDYSVVGFLKLINAIFQLLLYSFLAQKLGKIAFGQFISIEVAINFFNFLLLGALGIQVLRNSQIIFSYSFIKLVLCVIIFSSIGLFVYVYFINDLFPKNLILVLILLWLIALLFNKLYHEYLKGELKIKAAHLLGLNTSGGILSKILFIFLCFFFNNYINIPVVILFLSVSITFSVIFTYLFVSRPIYKLSWPWNNYNTDYRDTISFFFSNVLSFSSSNGILLVFAFFGNNLVIAEFAAFHKIVLILFFPLQVLISSYMPTLRSNYLNKDIEIINTTIVQSTLSITIFTTILGFVLLVFINPISEILFGMNNMDYNIFYILISSLFISILFGPNQNILLMVDDNDFLRNVSIILTLLFMTLYTLFYMFFGVYGTLSLVVILSLIQNVLFSIRLKRKFFIRSSFIIS